MKAVSEGNPEFTPHQGRRGSVCRSHHSRLPHRGRHSSLKGFDSSRVTDYLNRIPCERLWVTAVGSLVAASSGKGGCRGKEMRLSHQRGVGGGGKKKKKKDEPLWLPWNYKKFRVIGKTEHNPSGVLRTIQAETTHFTTRQVIASGSHHAGRWPGGPAGHQLALLPAGCSLSLSPSLSCSLSGRKWKPQIELAPQSWI